MSRGREEGGDDLSIAQPLPLPVLTPLLDPVRPPPPRGALCPCLSRTHLAAAAPAKPLR